MRVETLAVARKEMRQTLRDVRTLAVLVVAPVLQLVVLGYAVSLDVVRLPTIVVDADRSAASRAFVAELTAGDTFTVVARTAEAGEGVAALVAGEAQVALVLPRGFARAEAAGRSAAVQVLTDGSDANRAIVARNAVESFALQRGLARLRERGAAPAIGRPSVRPRVLYNPTLDSRVYFVPGVAATVLLVVTFVVTAMGLAREKEAGTLEQVLVTPLPPSALVIGKTLPYAVIGMLDLALVVAAGAAIFDVPLRGSLLLLAFAGALYLLTTLGLGLLVATLARNQQQAFMAAFFIILPMVLLSGFMSPVPNMPEWLQYATLLDPVRHFVEILRGVLLKAAGWADLAPQLVALGGMGVLVFLLSARALSRKLA